MVTQVMKNRDDSDEDLYKSLIVGNLGINQGMILENMVAQMLRASGHDLYFHEYLYRPEGSSREKKYEIDFMTVKKKKICPIEVKSSGYTSHKSFDYLIRKISVENGRQIYHLYERSEIPGWDFVSADLYDDVDLGKGRFLKDPQTIFANQ